MNWETFAEILNVVALFFFGCVFVYMGVHDDGMTERMNSLESSLQACHLENHNLRMMCWNNASSTRASALADDGRKVIGACYGDFFLVWSKDRNITSVLDTATHEYAHCNLGLVDP